MGHTLTPSEASSPRAKSAPFRRQSEILQKQSSAESFKETAESIVVAFILAFVFRTFVVEAFVIPTGSMAPTLYGKHGTLVCDNCGWENAYGLTDPSIGREPTFGPDSVVYCQNCDYGNTNLRIHDGTRRGSVRGNAESGDRILVFKWPLDFGIESIVASRWDVTVFKNPAEPDENFIKRLVGVPEEVLEIIDGDIYSMPISEASESTLEDLERRRLAKYRNRTRQGVSRDDARLLFALPEHGTLEELANKLTINRKSSDAQSALWNVVYDHDYPPLERTSRQPAWIADLRDGGPRWDTSNRKLRFDGVSQERQGVVRYSGKAISDHNAYNTDFKERNRTPVSDLRLESVVYLKAGEGFVAFTLDKRNDSFTVKLETDGRATLTRTNSRSGKSEIVQESVTAPLTAGAAVEVAFQNVDYRVTFEINGEIVLETTPEQYSPDIRMLRKVKTIPPTRFPRIAAGGVDVELWHIRLLRDVYYTDPGFDRTNIASWARAGWGTIRNPILLREGEYFMLGDNSPASKDSRLWDVAGAHLSDRGEHYQLGTVPADQIIGPAFFVYWPSGLRPSWLPISKVNELGVIPNVGRMRWIR